MTDCLQCKKYPAVWCVDGAFSGSVVHGHVCGRCRTWMVNREDCARSRVRPVAKCPGWVRILIAYGARLRCTVCSGPIEGYSADGKHPACRKRERASRKLASVAR
jgi:hypothetical protein